MLARVPPLLKLGLLGAIGLAVVRIVSAMVPGVLALGETVGLAINAAATPVSLAICAGLFELASRLTGRGRKGVLVAAYASVVGLLADLTHVVSYALLYASMDHSAIGFVVLGWVSFAVVAIGTIGYGIAAWSGGEGRRHHVAAVACTVLAIGAFVSYSYVPSLVTNSGDMDFAHRLALINGGIAIVRVSALIALVVLARPPIDAPSSVPLAARGLRMIGGALWWRLAATLAGSFSVLRFALAFGDDSTRSFQIALIAQASVEMILFALVGLGAFVVARANANGLSRRTFVLVGIGAGWCAGVMLAKVPYLYAFTNGPIAASDVQLLDALSIGEPIVAIAAIATAVFALRNVPGLADSASSRGLAFIVVMLGSIGLARLGDGLAGTVFGGILVLAVTAFVAAFIGRAARVLATEQSSLPTATVV
jgi:hypothetical protein